MSLSFVSKSIQTQDPDGDFKETAIEGADHAATSNEYHRPLFEQLRSNQEREEEEREEFQRAIMRGTLALDEDDAAYLSELQKERERQEALKQQQTELELAAFHAAKMEQKELNRNVSAIENKEDTLVLPTASALKQTSKAMPSKLVPTIIKKRRRGADEPSDNGASVTASSNSLGGEPEGKRPPTALVGLLSGYGSESSDGD